MNYLTIAYTGTAKKVLWLFVNLLKVNQITPFGNFSVCVPPPGSMWGKNAIMSENYVGELHYRCGQLC